MSAVTPAPRPARRRADRSDLVVGLAAIGGLAMLVWLGLGLTFFADEWAVISERSASLSDFLEPFNEHWLGFTILTHRAVFALVGLHTYVPYHALLAVLHVVVALEVYALVRRRTLRAVAVGMTLIVLVFGSGFENLFWAMQVGFVGATALGFGALLLVDDVPSLPGARRAWSAAVLLTIAVMTSGYGLFMLALVGWDLLLDPRRRRWIVPLLVPVAVYGTWYLVLGRSGVATHGDPFTLERIAAVPRFVTDGLGAAFGGATGWGNLVGPALWLGIVAWIIVLVLRRRPVPSRAVACLLAIASEYAILGLVRAQLGSDAAGYTRYTYLSGMLALVCIASLIGRPTISRRRVPWVVGAGILALAVSLAWNLQLLIAGRALFAERAELTRALVTIGTTDPLPVGVDPDLTLVLVPSPSELRRLTAEHGSPLTDALAPSFVPAVSAEAIEEATHRAQNPPQWLLEQETVP
jgi:hypothetical protein